MCCGEVPCHERAYQILGIALCALIAGLLLAYGFNRHYSLLTTVEAELLYGASDDARVFRFFAINWPNVGLILALVVICGLVAAIWPLLRNIRRSPIKDIKICVRSKYFLKHVSFERAYLHVGVILYPSTDKR
jgi:hypothetical protein